MQFLETEPRMCFNCHLLHRYCFVRLDGSGRSLVLDSVAGSRNSSLRIHRRTSDCNSIYGAKMDAWCGTSRSDIAVPVSLRLFITFALHLRTIASGECSAQITTLFDLCACIACVEVMDAASPTPPGARALSLRRHSSRDSPCRDSGHYCSRAFTGGGPLSSSSGDGSRVSFQGRGVCLW